MRFETFELARYGHFSDHRLVFPHQETDFHLVFGRNEAGKSTLRQAFHDLLFGIPMRTPMAFLHPGPDLALNAVLSGEAGSLAMGRRRKTRGGLVDTAGEPLAAEVLERWLGDVTPAFHERMFGLDHRRLEEGSRAMLQAGDDVDSVLFQAAAGVATLNRVLASLREEADRLWAPRASRNRAWYEAAERFKEADKTLKAATVRPTAWSAVQGESRRMDKAFLEARDRCAQLQARIAELERMRRVAPLLTQIRDLEARLQALDAGEQSPLLQFEADLLALEEMRVRVSGHAADLTRNEARARLLQEELAQVWRQLGRPVKEGFSLPEQDAFVASLPPEPLRSEIRQCLEEGKELRRRREAADEALQARIVEIQELRNRIASLPTQTVSTALRHALKSATAAGDLEATLQGLENRVRQEGAALEQRLAALRQPGLSIDLTDPEAMLAWLEAMQPFPAASLSEFVQRRQNLAAEREAAAKRVAEATREQQAAALRLEQFRRAHDTVSREEVLAARRERDALWEALASGTRSLTEHAAQFATLMRAADGLADRHLNAVGDAARQQALEHECERAALTVQGLQQHHDQLAGNLADFDARWYEECRRRGLPALSPTALQGWLPGREAALQSGLRAAMTREELVAGRRRMGGLHGELLAALKAEMGGTDAALEPMSVSRLCDHARSLLERAEETRARREALTAQRERLEALLPALESECRRSEEAVRQCRQRREGALDRAGLPAEADDAYVESALGLFGEADQRLQQLRMLAAERARLQEEVRLFLSDVGALAARLGQAVAAENAPDFVRRCLAELAPLRAAQQAREQAHQQWVALNAQLLEAGEGHDRGQLEAALADVDLSVLAADIQSLQLELEEAGHERDRLAVERQNAFNALQAISGSDEAAQAEARRQEALADMAEVAEQFVRVHAQACLLEHIAEQYRERSQGPLLARAGELFGRLTLGGWSGLVVDGEAATLLARRADGRLVPLEGLSDGTRDQLYLSLRLAALSLYLDSARPMPFIADDLFINYDDARTLAGLRELCEVSRRTQVIFLTHHAHMVELARDHLAGQIQVVEL